jgi:NitT/TauT family transport system substrate-binding protein
MPKLKRRDVFLLSGAAALGTTRAARAEDTLKLAIGQRGNWEESACEMGQDAGIFKKHGLALDILYTEGGGQTQQAVISGSVDIGVGVGTYGVLGAFSKGAPVRIIANCTVGAHDLYWYARAESPIHSIKDAAGKTVAFSTTGSSTNIVVLGFEKTDGISFQPTATGSPPATFTAVMSGQVDVGWAAPPFGLSAINDGRIRIIARGSEVPSFADQMVRVMIANAAMLERRADVVARFMQGYRESMHYLYSDPAALLAYAKWAGVTPELAKQARDGFYPETNLDPDHITPMTSLMKDAVEYKYLSAPLTEAQLAKLIQVPPKV